MSLGWTTLNQIEQIFEGWEGAAMELTAGMMLKLAVECGVRPSLLVEVVRRVIEETARRDA